MQDVFNYLYMYFFIFMTAAGVSQGARERAAGGVCVHRAAQPGSIGAGAIKNASVLLIIFIALSRCDVN